MNWKVDKIGSEILNFCMVCFCFIKLMKFRLTKKFGIGFRSFTKKFLGSDDEKIVFRNSFCTPQGLRCLFGSSSCCHTFQRFTWGKKDKKLTFANIFFTLEKEAHKVRKPIKTSRNNLFYYLTCYWKITFISQKKKLPSRKKIKMTNVGA